MTPAIRIQHAGAIDRQVRDRPQVTVIDDLSAIGRARAAAPGLSYHVPLLLVGIALTFLAVLPLLEQHRIAIRLDEISDVIDPARIATGDLQVALGLEAVGMRGYLLTGDDRYAASHHEAVSNRKRAYAKLQQLRGSLGPGDVATIGTLGSLLHEADALLDPFFAGQITRDGFMSHVGSQQSRLVAAMGLTTQLQHRFREVAVAKRNEIREIHRTGSYLSFAGVLIALAAVASVARMGSRFRALARTESASRAQADEAKAESEQRRQQAERIGASRAALMRGFSHDVKNALGVADGYLFMLEHGVGTRLSDDQRTRTEKARRSVRMATQLIENLLDLARAEAGELVLRPRRIDLAQLVTGVVDDYRAFADSRGLALDIEVGDDLPLVESDADRVAQILSNLISNALKYTDCGGVTVGLGVRHDEHGGPCAVVDVTDTGPGIPDAARRTIFDEFRRLDASNERQGTGIGLAISARIAAALGGRITVHSAVSHGSVFTLWLPLNAAGAIAAAREAGRAEITHGEALSQCS